MGNFITHCSTLRRMNYAQKLFDEMSHPNSFVWNTMVRGFQQNQEPRNALILFEKMKMRGVIGDKFTYPFVIRACNDLWEQCRGKCAHGEVLKHMYAYGFSREAQFSNKIDRSSRRAGRESYALSTS
ncbi:hypothetical protein ACET3Z_021852 [Daucus carota]